MAVATADDSRLSQSQSIARCLKVILADPLSDPQARKTDLPIGERTLSVSVLKMVDLVGIEPTTSSMPWKRAPSCATGPHEDNSVEVLY